MLVGPLTALGGEVAFICVALITLAIIAGAGWTAEQHLSGGFKVLSRERGSGSASVRAFRRLGRGRRSEDRRCCGKRSGTCGVQKKRRLDWRYRREGEVESTSSISVRFPASNKSGTLADEVESVPVEGGDNGRRGRVFTEVKEIAVARECEAVYGRRHVRAAT